MATKFWLVSHDADCTETGLPTRRTYIRSEWGGFAAQQYGELQILRDWCRERFGAETAYVQGVAPTPNWEVGEIDESAWERAVPIKWGGIATETRRVLLRLGAKQATSKAPVEVLVDVPASDKNWNSPRCPHCGGVLTPTANQPE